MNAIKTLGMSMMMLAMGASQALAEECEKLDASWESQIQKLSDLLQAQRYDDAKVLFDAMEKRCSRSPMLNYYEGKRRELIHDEEGAKKYFQRASEYTYDFAVEAEKSKEIWYKRYEAENPENSKEVYQRMKKESEAAVESVNVLETRIHERLAKELEEKERAYRIGLWSGVGVGIAGLVMLGIGSGFILGMDKQYSRSESETGKEGGDRQQHYRIKTSYNANLAVVGVGAAAVVVGAVLTGIYGYKLTHLDDSMTFSLQIAPNSAAFVMTF